MRTEADSNGLTVPSPIVMVFTTPVSSKESGNVYILYEGNSEMMARNVWDMFAVHSQNKPECTQAGAAQLFEHSHYLHRHVYPQMIHIPSFPSPARYIARYIAR